MPSPTERSLAHLRADGWEAGVVERLIKPPGRAPFRRDLFGCLDIVAVRVGAVGVLGVQTTDHTHVATRRRKLLDSPIMRVWLLGGNQLEVHGWKKGQPRPRVVEVTLEETKP